MIILVATCGKYGRIRIISAQKSPASIIISSVWGFIFWQSGV